MVIPTRRVLLGSVGHAVAGPTAPTIVSATPSGTDCNLVITVDNTVTAGDTITLQTAATGTSFASPTETTHPITVGEDAINECDLALSAFASGDYDVRCKVTHGTASGWSNAKTFTISATVNNPYFWLGF